MLKNKYHAKKTINDGITFDSKKESIRWDELRMLEKEGVIKDLQRQVKYTLIPAHKGEHRTERACTYIADFVYEYDGQTVVEDVKGLIRPEYVIKRKLMLDRFGISIKEVY